MKLKEKLRSSVDYERAAEFYGKKIVLFKADAVMGAGSAQELMNAVVAREALVILAAVAHAKEMMSGKEEEIELEG